MQYNLKSTGKLDHLFDLLAFLSADEMMLFDPEHKVISEYTPGRTMAVTGKFSKLGDVHDNLCFTIEDLRDNQGFQDLIRDILINDRYAFLTDGKMVSHNDLEDILARVSQLFPNQREKNGAEFLICKLIGLRIYQQIKYDNIPFPYATYTDAECERDFFALMSKINELSNNPEIRAENTKMVNLGGMGQGQIVSDNEMHQLRANTARDNRKTIVEKWSDISIHSRIASELRINITNYRKRKSPTLELSVDYFRKQLFSHEGVSQFTPLTVPHMIMEIQKRAQAEGGENSNAQIRRVLDLCAGWGDRLVGALATAATDSMQDSVHLESYTATDPNPLLHPGYQAIIERYKPHDFRAVVYNAPMEDLTPDQLKPNNLRQDLMLTSPPYFTTERYSGQGQSHQRYPTYSQWRDGFLYKLAEQSRNALAAGGYMAVYVGKSGKFDIPADLKTYLGSKPEWRLKPGYSSSLKSTEFIVAQLVGATPVPAQLISPPSDLQLPFKKRKFGTVANNETAAQAAAENAVPTGLITDRPQNELPLKKRRYGLFDNNRAIDNSNEKKEGLNLSL
ncbi:SAM-dependent methyltransferase [Legionella shakespearei]|uniref:Uncharacterized protein n=1 Tax=Legionella shakespearei DSM 23087 TaxID=1122169 RepID=A0A0W0Z0I8_9GAMM|nr:SAM-dependent methyltransferase [Legionella shakespearei]KTD62626.1 hypothetical protein Lsha_0979 [Legionella shakespearei DSM 23087]